MLKTRTDIRVLIIGAGMGGLSSALALAEKGYHVTVVEANEDLNEIGAGIQVSPNCTKILDHWGLTPDLENSVMSLDSIRFLRYGTGEVIGKAPLRPDMTEKFKHPYWLIHRASLQKVLYDGAIRAGARVLFSQCVASINPETPSAVLTDGQILNADLIIGADGIRSICRKFIFPTSVLDPVPTPQCAYRAVIPISHLHSHPDLHSLIDPPTSTAWLGPHRQLLGYPIQNHDHPSTSSSPSSPNLVYNLVGIHLSQIPSNNHSSVPVPDLSSFRNTFSDFDAHTAPNRISLLLAGVTSATKWQLANLPPLDYWSSENGKVVLLGDAAHAMVPFLAQGASAAVEDAAVLAECLGDVQSWAELGDGEKEEEKEARLGELRRRVSLYQHLRESRITGLRKGAVYNERMLHLEDGEEQRARDLAMRPGEEKNPCPNLWVDAGFASWLFGYDAMREAREAFERTRGGKDESGDINSCSSPFPEMWRFDPQAR